MFELDHVAIVTQDIPAAVKFYQDNFGAVILHCDSTWAFLRIGQGKVALVTPGQHPAHIALRVDLATLQAAAARAGKTPDTHRDGTQGIYLSDPSGNILELIHYTVGQTLYAASQSGEPIAP